MNLTGIRTYLDPELARTVSRAASAQNRSESSLIAEAVRARFAAEGPAAEAASSETQKRRLARLEARIDKLHRDQALVKETLFVFVRVWLEHNPPIDEALVESIAASAEARFERFLDLVAQGLQPGRSMANGDSGLGGGGHDDVVEAHP
jgi:predicted transcriptional regulator